MSFTRQMRRRELRRLAPQLAIENTRLRGKLDRTTALPVLGVFILMAIAFYGGYLTALSRLASQ